MKNIKKWLLRYFDWNNDGVLNWWEYLIPIIIVLIIEVTAEIIAKLLLNF